MSRTNRERKFQGANVPGSKKAKERKGQGANGPRNESSSERIGQGPIGRFAPGSELARERKGCESLYRHRQQLTQKPISTMTTALIV